jgi:ABC-type transport system substrate-binding protein
MSDRELREAAGVFRERQQQRNANRLSRRRVLSGSAILAAGGILAACGGGDDNNSSTPSGGGSTAAAGSSTAGSGGSTAGGEIPATLAELKYVKKYNWRNLKWGGTPYMGGTLQAAGYPPPNWDLMTTQTLTQFPPYYNGLYYSALHAGLNLETSCVEADLAQKSEHTPDYLSWTFTLPENVFFHDLAPVNGAQMTSADVKFSFERYIDTSLWNLPLAGVDHIEAPDPKTIKFVLKEPALNFPNILALPYYQVFNQKHFEDKNRWSTQPIGTGAFILKDSKALQISHAQRNPKYWDTARWLKGYENAKLPFVDNYVSTYYADIASLQAGLRGKSVDCADLEGQLPSVLEDLLKANPDLQVTTDAEWALTPHRIFLNWKNPLFADVRVRRALSMALDREQIVQVALGGAGIAASSPVPYDQMGLDGPPALKDMGEFMQFNKDKAKSLLAEAGHSNGFSFTAKQASASVPSWMTLVQKFFKDIGVDMKIETTPPLGTTQALVDKNFDAILSNSEGSILGYDIDQVMRPMFGVGSAANYASVDDKELNPIMDKIHSSTNPDEWTSLAKQAFDVFNKNQDVLYVHGFHTWYAAQPWVHTIANTYYTTIANYAAANYRNVWVDDTAPGGRGGKKVS